MAGYSGTPLPKELGIKEGHRVALLRPPDGLHNSLRPLPDGVAVRSGLWVAWPKKSSGLATDLDQ